MGEKGAGKNMFGKHNRHHSSSVCVYTVARFLAPRSSNKQDRGGRDGGEEES